MKIFNLFEANTAAFDLKPTVKNKILEYLKHDTMIGPRNSGAKWIKEFKVFKGTYSGEFPALQYCFNTSRTKKEFMEDYYDRLQKSFKIQGNTIFPGESYADWRVFYLGQIDKLGEPPFLIGEGFEKIEIKSAKLKAVPSWLPAKSEQIKLELPNLKTLKDVQHKIKECKSITIYTNNLEELGILGLFEIKNLKYLDFGSGGKFPLELTMLVSEIMDEINSSKSVDIFEIQEKLIEAGFKKNARY